MKNVKKIILIVSFAFICSIYMVLRIGKNLNPIIKSYSTIEAERFGIYMINHSLDNKFLKEIDDDIFTTTINSKGEIQMIDFKSKKVNEILEKATRKVQKNLIKLENGDIEEFELADTFRNLKFKKVKKGVVCELPEGTVYSNSLLANNGPIIPIKLNFIGQVTGNMKTKMKNYGINNTYFEITINIEVKERVSMPLRSEEVTVRTSIPIAMKIIQGTIPNYYQTPLVHDSNQISFPIY